MIYSKFIFNFDIIGSPTVYNQTDNNYTCITCNTDYYNLYTNNIEPGKSRDPDENKFIKCKDQTTTIKRHHWMGIMEKYSIMFSNVIMSMFNPNGCDYSYDEP